ncbi:helicase Cas3 [Rothia dentocariosa]|uniref:Helicase Cas3 n=1 Tax=Rothia dentocariosa TaxID=2047 RepID=A0A3S4YHE7_9MICC|nr:helicase Cas3 [Rothia dentocariosa]
MTSNLGIQRSDFSEFFAALNGGYAPFTWQQELVDHIVKTGSWPDRIVAPTGAGKSSVVDVHLFVNALYACGTGPRVPRRLNVVVGRRALVDSQADRAREILDRMKKVMEDKENVNSQDDIIRRVAEALLSFQVYIDAKNPFEIGHIRGELSNRSLPVNEISACAIIAATPDMWGSRLLFRGYGSSKGARPRETAVVSMDSVMVLDEAHLNQQLLVTARRIAQLQKYGADVGVPTLQVVETTATPSELEENQNQIGVDVSQLDSPHDAELLRRVNSVKRLTRIPLDKWNGKAENAAVINSAVDEVLGLCKKLDPNNSEQSKTVGCIVNHVGTAVKVADKLKKENLSVKLIVGRMRPFDMKKLRGDHPDLFTCKGDSNVDVVVATQTLEVGIDLDFSSLVTELAPASSLAQRFGRVNRLGKRHECQIIVLEPENPDKIKDPVALPYKAEDLRKAYGWLNDLSAFEDVNPGAMLTCIPPATASQRLLYQRPELVDILEFARSSETPYAEPDFDLWLHDSLEEQIELGGVVVREHLPLNDSEALELLKAFPPMNEEVFPANIKILSDIYKELVVGNEERIQQERENPNIRRRAFVYRAGELEICSPDMRLRPGDVLVIDKGLVFTTQDVAVELGKAQDLEAPSAVVPEGIKFFIFDNDIEHDEHGFFKKFCGLTPDEATELWQSETRQTGEVVLSSSIRTDPHTGDIVAWYTVVQSDTTDDDSDVRQEWTPSQGAVYLEDHQHDVAERSKRIVESVGLQEEFAKDIIFAAEHHDDGKADSRFQFMLGGAHSDKPLAKSEVRTRQEIWVSRQRSGMPAGWRHEQMSVALVAAGRASGELECSDLALRIIGCSHGHGRNSFQHTDQTLLGENTNHPQQEMLYQQAHELFLTGRWDEIMENTDREYGPYATAYLEALERAADAQISREGH